MRLIDPIELKRSIAFSSMVHDGKTLEQIIDEQPSAEPEHKWIPCSERLPKRSVEVLTCDSVGTIEVRSLDVSYDGMVYWESQEGECARLNDAIAWMPLPEPFKEVEHED